MTQTDSKIKSLGEIALRVSDLDIMSDFYEKKIGLELMRRFDHAAFFKIAEGYSGHTQILALFDRKETNLDLIINNKTSSIDHIAFGIALIDFDSEKIRLERHGLQVDITTHAWVKWRSMYVSDPEGNRVELVCYDDSVT